MATPFKFDTKAHGNINDSGIKDLPLGKHNYVITKITYAPIKADPTKKRSHLIIELRHEQGGKFTQFLEIHPKNKEENEITRARIAADEFNSYVQATGFSGVVTPEKFKVLYEKTIGIETRKTVVKATSKEYINVTQIIKDGFPDEELTPMGATSKKPDAEPDEEEADEEEDAPAPAKAPKKKKGKPAPPVVEEEEDDEDEEEEESDEDEEEEDEEDPFA